MDKSLEYNLQLIWYYKHSVNLVGIGNRGINTEKLSIVWILWAEEWEAFIHKSLGYYIPVLNLDLFTAEQKLLKKLS